MDEEEEDYEELELRVLDGTVVGRIKVRRGIGAAALESADVCRHCGGALLRERALWVHEVNQLTLCPGQTRRWDEDSTLKVGVPVVWWNADAGWESL